MRVKTVFFLLALSPLPASATVRLLVPAYFDPSSSTGWSTLISSVAPTVPITAIMNPNSGPTAKVDPTYTAAINSFESDSGQVVAYVHTSYGARSINAVEKDISIYKSEYPQIDGIFLDEMDNTSANLTYYKTLYSYIKTESSSWQVIGNPGTNTLSTYLSPTPAAADELVTFESGAGYSAYTPSPWQSNYSASSFANIVYAVPDVPTMQADLSQAVADRTGNVYFSDLTGSNPYSALPTYWSQEVAAVSAINTPPKATYIKTSSGDFNASSNWSASVPNGVGAEADFLAAITANHTVYSDYPITLGTIVFNNPHSYVLAGAGSLTLQALTGSAMVAAESGSQTISLPINVASNTIFNASAGATLTISGPITVNSGLTLTESGSGSIRLLGSMTLQSEASASLLAGSTVQSLDIGPAATASLIAPAIQTSAALTTQSLSLSAGATLDLAKQALIVVDGNVADVQSLVSQQEVIDSLTGSNHLMGIGVISDSVGAEPLYSSFDGTSVDSSDLLIKSASFGDTNLDGQVNASDYTRVDAGFTAGLTGWFNGDFNHDGVVDGSDFALMDNAYNAENAAVLTSPTAQTTAEIATVPEPVIAGWLIGLSFMLRRVARTRR